MVPLIAVADAPQPIRDLNPIFDVDGQPHVLLPQAIASVPTGELRPAIMSLDSRHDSIPRAIDVLMLGF